MNRRDDRHANHAARRRRTTGIPRCAPGRLELRLAIAALLVLLTLACGAGDEGKSPDAAGGSAASGTRMAALDAANATAAVTTPGSAAQTPDAKPGPTPPPTVSAAPAADADLVRLTRAQIDLAGIAIEAARPGPVDSGIQLVGEVHPNGDRLAHITPRFPGIVREVQKRAGDVVHAGDVLAVIESSDSLAPYTVKTAIDGIVIAKDLTRGEAVERTKQAFVVADLSSVWVDLAVYQKDLGRIPMGQRVHIDAVGEGPAAEGTISYITPSVDQVTRTATARVVVENRDRKFLPGMFVTAHTLDIVDAPVTVRGEAIQTVGGQSCVFVEVPDGLVRRPVVLGREGTERVAIRSGLAAGERIAVENSFLLKAELAKGEIAEED
ncbi:MAG: efflux RND transporter periplasmic adaptor subunit [Deltaproteobacteria bacterium]|nr:efflux RND transporter periplasmic adaptor subunit [Deltaproteobacteria bacterium]